jgi:hypothetical protein
MDIITAIFITIVWCIILWGGLALLDELAGDK